MSMITVTPYDVLWTKGTSDGDRLILRWLQGQCGGPVEAIQMQDNRVMWVHEEGKLLGMACNVRATRAMRAGARTPSADWVAGSAVITGRSGPNTTLLTDNQLARTYADLGVH